MTRKTEHKGAISPIARQIEEAMNISSMNGTGSVEATFTFREDFAGFQGHFPANKIFPGVCQVQCVLALLSRWQGAEARLSELTNVKYVLPIIPGDVITLKITGLKDLGGGLFSLKASILNGAERVSDFRLKARLGHSQDA
jgi:3-hydroxymyristoyl/3-hydroxydecanoyl-(acyl carrier protein) dehydratase